MSATALIVFMSFTILSSAFAQEGCGNCFQLNTGTIIGIVVCDALITLIIASMAFWISTKIQKKKYQEKLKKLKTLPPTNDPTYEELHGQRVDIYNDLHAMRN
ncbi:TYRO protein tyrosine kinase-binding protein-like [Anomaloglossus baeobatrachus]|uniref:TYRO protein tyrosine kinase-binding protein-like n=1 Tax=Anomaloglossus baeobatrachus TaxID=238106 RepID=UPI003F501381